MKVKKLRKTNGFWLMLCIFKVDIFFNYGFVLINDVFFMNKKIKQWKLLASFTPFTNIVTKMHGNHHKVLQILTSKSRLTKTCDYTCNPELFFSFNMRPTILNTWWAIKAMFGNWVSCPIHHASGFSHYLRFTCQQWKNYNWLFKVENIACSL
jgi:hypothetical protein